MAFSATKDIDTVIGNVRLTSGTYTNSGGDTGGDITTGLQQIVAMWFCPTGSSVVADSPTLNETLPMAGSTAATIICTANSAGRWFALGY